MQSFDIKNPRVLALLEKFRYLYIDKYDVQVTNPQLDQISNRPDTAGPEYRDHIVSLGREHLGGPATANSHPLKPPHYQGDDPQYKIDFYNIDEEFKIELGIPEDSNALSQLYPPKGYIAWHNNANAVGWNLLFTWSETGEGWFKYIDKYGKEITIPDKKGWSVKGGYFGSYDEDNKLCYHAAYTDCLRLTQSFVIGKNYDYWKDCINYISGE
jgi:hypothetical protein